MPLRDDVHIHVLDESMGAVVAGRFAQQQRLDSSWVLASVRGCKFDKQVGLTVLSRASGFSPTNLKVGASCINAKTILTLHSC